MAAKFEYVSDLRLIYPGGYVYWEVDIKNVGDAAGTCTVHAYRRMQAYGEWSGFGEEQGMYIVQSATIAPGSIVTFSGRFWDYPYFHQYMVVSGAGVLLNPAEPGRFLCWCCYWKTGQWIGFDTQEEFNDHYASTHPEYLAMAPLRSFSVKGTAWPDHFTKYGEDYGKIISWYAIAFTSPIDPGTMWDGYVEPDDGAVYRGTDQPCAFTMPSGFVGARLGPCGYIPNSTKIRVYFQTDQGWTGWMDDSGYIDRVPDGSLITFAGGAGGCSAWQVGAPEPEPQFSEFAIADFRKV